MWHWREKPSISSFLKKIRVHDWIKTPLEFAKRWGKTWRWFVLSDHLKLLNSRHWAIREAFADLNWPFCVFRQLSGLDLGSNRAIVQSSRKNFRRFFSSPSYWRRNFVKFFVTSQVEFLFNHGTQTFQEKLEIEGVRVTSSVYCSMP